MKILVCSGHLLAFLIAVECYEVQNAHAILDLNLQLTVCIFVKLGIQLQIS